MALKEKLLSLSVVDDNEYLDKYCVLVENNRATKKEKFNTQKHHVVPRSYFKIKNLKLDNSVDNIVNLSYKNHILVHYYLYMCSIGQFRYSALRALTYLIGRIDMVKTTTLKNEKIKIDFDENYLYTIIPNLVELKYLDNFNEHNKNRGGKWMNNKKIQQYVKLDEVQDFLLRGYIIGKLPVTAETKKKISSSQLGKIRKPCSEERKRKISIANTGRHHSDDTKEKLRQYNIGKPAWNKNKHGVQGKNKTTWHKGNVPWNTGKHFSEESRKKMSEARKKYFERIKNDKK